MGAPVRPEAIPERGGLVIPAHDFERSARAGRASRFRRHVSDVHWPRVLLVVVLVWAWVFLAVPGATLVYRTFAAAVGR